jgi:hypothetical protein
MLILKYETKNFEKSDFRHFLRREKYPFNESGIIYNRSTSKPGSSWFLISMEWWLRWELTCASSIINSKELKNKKPTSTKSTKPDNKSIKIFFFYFLLNRIFPLELSRVILTIVH